MNGSAETRRVLLLSAGVGGGHIAAARALEAVFRARAGVDVRHVDALRLSSAPLREIYAGLYAALLKRSPHIVGWWYDRENEPFRPHPLRTAWELRGAAPLVEQIRSYDPDITVCTHFMPANIVAQLIRRGATRSALSLVITDYDVQGMWLNPAVERYFVPLDETRAYMELLGVPTACVTVSGIPVAPRFEMAAERLAVLTAFGLSPQSPILVVSAGLAGHAYVQTVVEQLIRVRHPMQAVVLCGANERLRQALEPVIAPHRHRFRLLGVTANLPELMQVATLYIGKPGGLSSAECMAAGLPMVLVAPIPGQEERNADHLLEAGVAIRCRDLPLLAYKIDRLLSDAARLADMRARTAQLARPDAAGFIADTLLQRQPACSDRAA